MQAYFKLFLPQHTFPDTETQHRYCTTTAVIKAKPLSPTQPAPSHAGRLYASQNQSASQSPLHFLGTTGTAASVRRGAGAALVALDF